MSDNSRLRELYSESVSATLAFDDHLQEAAWERLALGESTAGERRLALRHVARCPECARIYRGLSLLEEGARGLDPEVPRSALSAPSARRSRRWLIWPALAAAAMVLILVVPSDMVTNGEKPAGDGPDALRSTVADRPMARQPLGRMNRRPEGFAWSAVATDAAYRVELFDGDGEPIWESEPVAATDLAWPESVPGSPGSFYWRVVAIPESGGEEVASELVSLEVVAAASGG